MVKINKWLKRQQGNLFGRLRNLPDDSKSWESPNEADIVWRLFIQILFR